jgi:hypothetical protein
VELLLENPERPLRLGLDGIQDRAAARWRQLAG